MPLFLFCLPRPLRRLASLLSVAAFFDAALASSILVTGGSAEHDGCSVVLLVVALTVGGVSVSFGGVVDGGLVLSSSIPPSPEGGAMSRDRQIQRSNKAWTLVKLSWSEREHFGTVNWLLRD